MSLAELHAAPAGRSEGDSELHTLRRGLALLSAVALFYGAVLMITWIPMQRGPTWPELAVIGAGVGLAVLLLVLRRHLLSAASAVGLLGALALILAAWIVFGRVEALALLALHVVMVGMAYGPRAALPAAAVDAGLVVLLARWVVRSGEMPWFWLILLLLAGVLGMLNAKELSLLEVWERQLAYIQERLIGQLRARQGELNRTLKALDEAYATLKRTNEELLVARKEAEAARVMKEQFVANVSHELRTPLNLVVGFAEMMYLAPETYEGVVWTRELESDVQQMYRAGRHLQSMVNDILDLSRIDASRLPMLREAVDVRRVIVEALETTAPLFAQRGLWCSLELPPALPELFIDRTRIRQVLINLLNNAVRYVDEGGVTVAARENHGQVIVSVADTGIGIEPEQLERIFEEFHQADVGLSSRGGAGLGLAISKQFVELHGGRLWAESQVGVGSIFSFSLPCPGSLPERMPLVRTPASDRAATARAPSPVLLVDPDPSIAEMLGRYLGDRPVLPVADEAQADALIEELHPQAVIVNQLPTTPPSEWLRDVGDHSRTYDVPVMRCAIPSPSWLREESALDDCLTKPVSRDALADALRRYGTPGSQVLVVDDSPAFIDLMVRMLRTIPDAGTVSTATSGRRAVELAIEHRPDLVLLDLLMPEMDGFAVLREIRALPDLAHTKVVAVTATSYAEDALLRRGGHLTITKPGGLTTGTIAELLEAALQAVFPNYVPLDNRA